MDTIKKYLIFSRSSYRYVQFTICYSNIALWNYSLIYCIIRPRHSRSAAAYSDQTFPADDLSLRASVCPVLCGKTADRIRMPFGCIGRTGAGMRQVVGFGDQSTGRGTFGGKFVARHCNQWGLYGVRVRQCRDAALFPNYFGQTCYYYYSGLLLYCSISVSHKNAHSMYPQLHTRSFSSLLQRRLMFINTTNSVTAGKSCE